MTDAAQDTRVLMLLRLSGDVSTKAPGTKERFLRRLTRNLQDALESSGIEYEIRRDRFRFYLEADPRAQDVVPRVFGLQSLSPVVSRSWKQLEDILVAGEEIFHHHVAGKRFAVRARRGGQTSRIPFGSMDVERHLGRILLEHAERVDLSYPEVTAFVEVHPGTVFFFTRKIPARGGLPIGEGGRALALVSGGFDSAVASWLLLKRGVELDYLFCNLGGQVHRDGVRRVMKVVAEQWSYGYRPRLFEVDFQPVVRELEKRATSQYWQILLKRQMMRAAEVLASRIGAPALVTGEAVGQVSSQTLPNLAVISNATALTVLRPLIGFNKDEIIDIAREIGTFAPSAAVDEYCAILPRHPATHAGLKAIEIEEANLDRELLDRILDTLTEADLRSLGLRDSNQEELAVEEVEEGAVLIDLRSRVAYEAWHYPDALYLDFSRALETCSSFDLDQTYVFYCEVGQKSAYLAEVLRGKGYRAYYLKAGARRGLRRAAETGHLSL